MQYCNLYGATYMWVCYVYRVKSWITYVISISFESFKKPLLSLVPRVLDMSLCFASHFCFHVCSSSPGPVHLVCILVCFPFYFDSLVSHIHFVQFCFLLCHVYSSWCVSTSLVTLVIYVYRLCEFPCVHRQIICNPSLCLHAPLHSRFLIV